MQRDEHHRWLAELTRIPTAAGHEHRVIEWVRAWCAERDDVVLTEDVHGNMHLSLARPGAGRPVYFTAHLDHPAFVVERVVGPGTIELAFRGGVMDDYFPDARIVVYPDKGEPCEAVITEKVEGPDDRFKRFLADVDGEGDAIRPGDVATWHLPEQETIDGVFYTNACDDLAAVAAALAAFDVLRRGETTDPVGDVRVLLTRAEEVGFVGAIGVSRDKLLPDDSRIIALENSRSFTDSPIGGGPIVRVGDRISIFSPSLTAAVSRCAEGLGGAALPLSTQKDSELPDWRWQRKLMAGGACEASVFCAYGYESMCCCLPLGNYHNMADLAEVQEGTFDGIPRVGREHIALSDFDGLVDLLVACGTVLPTAPAMLDRMEKLWADLAYIIE